MVARAGAGVLLHHGGGGRFEINSGLPLVERGLLMEQLLRPGRLVGAGVVGLLPYRL
jgi:hypothetical protein